MPTKEHFSFRGPIWWTFTRVFSRTDPAARYHRKLVVLESLHATTRFTDLDVVPSTWTEEEVALLKEHINADWCGLVPDGEGGWTEPAELGEPPTGSGIGAWATWWGRAEPVTREAVIRAIEVSLGVEHRAWNPSAPVTLEDYGLSPDAEPPRNWPIEFGAVSPAPSFSAEISWSHDRDDEQRGRISVTWSTPGDGTPLRAELTHDEPSAGTRFGSWIVAQAHHEVVPYETWAPSALGEWISPVSTVWSHGPIVTSAPDLAAGGVDPDAEF